MKTHKQALVWSAQQLCAIGSVILSTFALTKPHEGTNIFYPAPEIIEIRYIMILETEKEPDAQKIILLSDISKLILETIMS